MKQNFKHTPKINIMLLTMLIFFAFIFGFSYAYFVIQVSGNEEASSLSISASDLKLNYTDSLVIDGVNMSPGWSQTKTLSVYNSGTDTVFYKIIWKNLLNEIIGNELVISAICTSSSGSCDNIDEMIIGTYLSQTSNITIKDKINIAPGVTHTYDVTVTFKETGSNQNYNQNKMFIGTLSIAEGDILPLRSGIDPETGLPVVRIGSEVFLDLTNAINYNSLISTTGNIYNWDSSKSVLFAKYNLYVGRIKNGDTYTIIDSSDVAYGLQKETAKASASTPSIGVVPFAGSSSTNGYWYDSANSTIYSKYGTLTNSANNVYDTKYITAPNWNYLFINNPKNTNYSIAYYVQNYINGLGVEVTGRLLTFAEANALTQIQRTNGAVYWIGSAYNHGSTRYIDSSGDIYHYSNFSRDYNCGVRPIVIIPTSIIKS